MSKVKTGLKGGAWGSNTLRIDTLGNFCYSCGKSFLSVAELIAHLPCDVCEVCGNGAICERNGYIVCSDCTRAVSTPECLKPETQLTADTASGSSPAAVPYFWSLTCRKLTGSGFFETCQSAGRGDLMATLCI
jgi:hypothetical protein